MQTLLHLSWRVYPAFALMALGGLLAVRSIPWHFARRSLLDRVIRIWRVSIWLALVAVGYGWWQSIGWVMGIGIGFFIAEGWESGMVIGGMRMQQGPAERHDDR
jgi:hypothetical protein